MAAGGGLAVDLRELVEAACAIGPAEWRERPPTDFVVAPVSGGMSNLIFRVALREDAGEMRAPLPVSRRPASPLRDDAGSQPAPPTVRRLMARVLSPQLDDVIDRAREARVVAWISAHPGRIGPRLFGATTLGLPGARGGGAGHVSVRFEEWVDGRTLVVADLRDDPWIVARVARKIAVLHASPPPWLDAAPAGTDAAARAAVATAPYAQYLECARRLSAHPRMRTPELAPVARLLCALPSWDAEAAWLAERLGAWGGPTVLTHGDMQGGNWILSPDGGGAGRGPDVVLIDYEYARPDVRGFDTGNLLCENTFDYTLAAAPGYSFDAGAYPPVAWQRAFFTQYAESLREAEAEAAAAPVASADTGAGAGGGDGSRGVRAPTSPGAWPLADAGVDDDGAHARTSCASAALAAFPAGAVRDLAREARLGVLASHLYWALWGALMAAGKLGVRVGDGAGSDDGGDAAAATERHSGGGGGGSVDHAAASVASGHSVFDYAHYGYTRAREFARLKAQWEADGADGAG